MNIYVYDIELNLIGVVDEINSLIWQRKYWECGEFKMFVPFNEKNRRMLKRGNIITRENDNESAQIRYLKVTKKTNQPEMMEVQGKFTASWISKRLVLNAHILTDSSANILNQIVYQNCINDASDPARNIPNLVIGPDDISAQRAIQFAPTQFENVLDIVENIAKYGKLGFRIIADVATKKYIFNVYQGRDLTANNNDGNNPCIFSDEFENILEQEFAESDENLKNTAYVISEDNETEHTPKMIVVVGANHGIDRVEMKVNAGDIRQKYEENGVQTVLPENEFKSLIEQRGREEINQHHETLYFDAKININMSPAYRVDYDLGDRVTFQNMRWNIQRNVRITEVSEIYEAGHPNNIEITFGESMPSLIKQLKYIVKK